MYMWKIDVRVNGIAHVMLPRWYVVLLLLIFLLPLFQQLTSHQRARHLALLHRHRRLHLGRLLIDCLCLEEQ